MQRISLFIFLLVAFSSQQALSKNVSCLQFFAYKQVKSILPFTEDSKVDLNFSSAPNLSNSSVSKELMKKSHEIYSIRNATKRQGQAKEILRQYYILLKNNSVNFKVNRNQNGDYEFVFEPTGNSPINQLAKVLLDQFKYKTKFVPQSLFKKKAKGYIISYNTHGMLSVSIKSVLFNMVTMIENHELVHVYTDWLAKNGYSSLFNGEITLNADRGQEKIKYRLHSYDEYLSLDEVPAYIQTIVEYAKLFDIEPAKAFIGVAKYSRLLAQMARKIQSISQLTLDKEIMKDPEDRFDEVYISKYEDTKREYIGVELFEGVKRLSLLFSKHDAISPWSWNEMVEGKDYLNILRDLLEHELSNGQLKDLLEEYNVSPDFYKLHTIGEVGSSDYHANFYYSFDFTISNNKVQLYMNLINYDSYKDLDLEYTLQKSQHSDLMHEYISRDEEEIKNKIKSNDTIEERLRLLAVVHSQVEQLSTSIIAANKDHDSDRVISLLNELVDLANKHYILN